MDYKLTRAEQETHLWINADSKDWDFHTLDPKFVRRMAKRGYTLEKDHQGGWNCRIPLDRIRILKSEKRKLSPEELEMRRVRMAKMRSAQN